MIEKELIQFREMKIREMQFEQLIICINAVKNEIVITQLIILITSIM